MNSLQTFFATLLATTLLTFSGAVLANDPDFELRGDPEKGRDAYQLQCVTCHGQSAQGDGPAAVAFDPPPSDLTRNDLSAERMFLATRDGGMAVGLSATMPAFGRSLGEDTVHDIVAYLMSLHD